MGFWEEPQGAAVFKHRLIREYAPVFASKVGKYSSGHRVGIVDCFAGQGWYEDGTKASAALALDTASRLAANRRISCWFIENDRKTYERLAAGVQESPAATSARVLHGTADERLDKVLAEAGDMPLFVFVDPYGRGLDFDVLVHKLLRRPAKTEVLINFVRPGLYRPAGKLDVASSSATQLKAADGTIRGLNANLGGSWWQSLWKATDDKIAAVEEIRDHYVARLLAQVGNQWGCFRVPVADRPGAKTIYDLLLFSAHPHGPWCFNDAVSLARKAFEEHFDPNAFELGQLWSPEQDWVWGIARNLKRMLIPGRPVALIGRITEVYGEWLGVARQKHVKRAVNQLRDEVVIEDPGRREPLRLTLVPTARTRTTGAATRTDSQTA